MPFCMKKKGEENKLFYSTSPSFLIREISSNHFRFYSKFIESYHQYVSKHPFTFLSQILALFELTDPSRYFIVEKNVFNEFLPSNSCRIFNLEDSCTPRPTSRNSSKISLGYGKKFQLLEQMELDCIVY